MSEERAAEKDARLSADDADLGKVVIEAVTQRSFVRVADDRGTKWWVHVLPAEAEGDSIWNRSISVTPPGADQ